MPNVSNGTITNIYSTDKLIKNGPRAGQTSQLWTIVLDDGNEYDNGFRKPENTIGQTVGVEWEQKYGKRCVGRLLAPGSAPTTAPPTGGGSGPAPAASAPAQDLPKHYFIAKGYANLEKSFPVPNTHPDRSIIRQSCLARATDIVLHGTDAGAGVEFEEVADRIIEVAYKLEDYASGQREVKAMEQLGE